MYFLENMTMYPSRLELGVYTQTPTGLSRVARLKFISLSFFSFFFFEVIHACFHIKPLTLVVCLNLPELYGSFSPGLCLDWQPPALLKGMPCANSWLGCLNSCVQFMCLCLPACPRHPEHVGHIQVETHKFILAH